MGSPKQHYKEHFATLITISLFVGSIAFTTQFLLPAPYGCTKTLARLHTLLAVSTLILLSNILSVLLLSTLIHPLHDHELATGYRKLLLRWGIAIIYLYLLCGLVLFALAVHVAYPGDRSMGWVGVGIFGVLFLATITLGLTTKGPRSDDSSADHPIKANLAPRQKNVSDVGILKIITILLVFVFEFAALIALLVIGGKNAHRGSTNKDCGDGSLGGGIPWSYDMPLPINVIKAGWKL